MMCTLIEFVKCSLSCPIPSRTIPYHTISYHAMPGDAMRCDTPCCKSQVQSAPQKNNAVRVQTYNQASKRKHEHKH